MTPRIDRYGDPLNDNDTGPEPTTTTIRRLTIGDRCDDLRRIIREAQTRRKVGQ